MKLSLPFREKSPYMSIDKCLRVGVILPHLHLCLWEVRERTDKEFNFLFEFGGLVAIGQLQSFYREHQAAAVLVNVASFYGVLKKHF